MQLKELAQRLGGTIEGRADIEISGVSAIEEAGEGDITFVANPKYRRMLESTRASAVIVGPDDEAHGRTVVRVGDPYLAFAEALGFFDDRPIPVSGVHSTAVIAPSARIGKGAYIGPYAVVGENVVIGRDAKLHPHVTIYPGARIGDRFTAHSGAVVREGVLVGDDATLQPGAVVGGDGFGFVPRPGDVPVAIPQTGTVELGDSVDIGANSTVDRATVGATRVGRGTKLDNLVMIGHGCCVGERCLLAGQFGVAGSSTIGDGVMAGGQAGVSGHLRVGDDARLAAQTGVAGNVAAGRVVAGSPASDIGVWRRYTVLFRRLPELFRRVARLERALPGARPDHPDADA